ncbi:MAG: hypothetical protein ACLGI3_12450, partial [Actinomycetes bacterium]
DHREPYREAGLGGRLVVHPRCSETPAPAPLPGAAGCDGGGSLAAVLGGSAALAVIAAGATVWHFRRRRPTASALAPASG